MRVKISYGIELDDLPDEMKKLYDSISEWIRILDNQSDTAEDLLEAEEYESCLSMMNKMQETMVKMDTRIADIYNILEGYVLYKKQNGVENDPPERRSPVDTAGNDVISRTEQSNGGNDEPGAESGDIS